MNVDRLYRVDHIAKAGEELDIFDFTEGPGGSAANTVVGLSRLGVTTGFIGIVSNDREGIFLMDDLKKEGVDLEGITISGSERTGVVHGYIDRMGERALYVDPGINDALVFEDINVEYANATRFLHLSSFVGEKPFLSQKRIVNSLMNNVKLSFDPGHLYARRSLSSLSSIIRRTHVFFPNEEELRLLTGEEYDVGSEILVNMGAHIIAVKMGSRGCYITDGKESHLIDPYEVNVVDTTGAGDAFCTGFLYGLLKGRSLQYCGKMGNYIASRCITRLGARTGLPLANSVPRKL
jgi:ribokinase